MPSRTSLQVWPRWTPAGRSDYRRARRVVVAEAPRYLPGLILATPLDWIPFGVLTREIDQADWSGPTVSFYFEAVLKTTNAGFACRARLWNVTNNVLVSSILTTSTSAVRVRSVPITLPSGSKEYRVDFGGLTGATFTCYSADLIAEVA